MKPIVKTRKKIKCSLCGKNIESGSLKLCIKDDESNEVINSHINCFNIIHKKCIECSKKCEGYKKCFKDSIKNVSVEDVMNKIKFLFDNIETIHSVIISNNKVILKDINNSNIGEINLIKIFGENSCIEENNSNIYKEWYEQKDIFNGK